MSIEWKRLAGSAWLVLVVAATPASCARHVPPASQPATTAAPASPSAPAPAAPAPVPVAIPDRISDADFWRLSTEFSEPNGVFRSDNLLSNEIGLQSIIPDLLNVARPGRVYMGVGPEQNFTYIAALKPAMAIIVDVRRGNLDLHLMYKALFEMSSDRVDFVSNLFSRRRPEGLTAGSSVREIFQAYATAARDDELWEANFDAIIDQLEETHGFALSDEDVAGVRFVYEYFGREGPELTYWMSSGFGGRGGFRNSPTYADLMTATDDSGTLRSYLATEDNFQTMKSLESRNLLLPVVGNFAGPKAVRAVSAWLRQHNAIVSAFYLSNVEQYLQMDGIWMDFCSNAAQLPIDETSQFIRSYRGVNRGYGPGGLEQGLSPMTGELKACGTVTASR
ncbi:MAG TPA: hypothetical protein VEL79_22405 [Vicinamibacterales bacterium]|nr:hypothetical protein [Vicinamibacterales bacterium]